MDWTSLQETLIGFYDLWQSLAHISFILLGTLVATLVIHLLLRKRYRRPYTSEHVWRDAFVGALNAPLQAVVWIIGFSIVEAALTTDGRMPRLAEAFRRHAMWLLSP